jgi:hypothetical protein
MASCGPDCWDDPVLARKFNSHAITAQGMSRSGWLAAPFAPATTVSYAAPRSAQQVAEAILDGTGWTLDWQLPLDPGWLIPAKSLRPDGHADGAAGGASRCGQRRVVQRTQPITR